MPVRPVFYVSDGTGITAETIGHSLLTQFGGLQFVTDRLPFVDTPDKARQTAAKIRQAALGYRAQVVQEAAGEAARFNQVYAQYKLAPAVTRERLYIETMERVLSKSNKVVIDSKGASAPIILPPDVFKPRAPTGAAQ